MSLSRRQLLDRTAIAIDEGMELMSVIVPVSRHGGPAPLWFTVVMCVPTAAVLLWLVFTALRAIATQLWTFVLKHFRMDWRRSDVVWYRPHYAEPLRADERGVVAADER